MIRENEHRDNAAYIGTKLKYLFGISANGFDMTTDDYSVSLYCGGRTLTLLPPDILYDADSGNHYLVIDTSVFRSGMLYITVTAIVPDSDFPDGVRLEIVKQPLIRLLPL